MDLISQYSSDEEEHPPVSLYSQNYHHHMKCSSLFVYVPWNPSRNIIHQLNSQSNAVINRLNLSRVQWTPVSDYFNKFKYHITVCPNFFCKQYMVDEVKSTIVSALSTMKIDNSLVGEDSQYIRLQKQLSLPTNPSKSHFLKLKFNRNLHLFPSPTSEKVFLAATLENQGLLRSISDLVVDAVSSTQVPVSPDPDVLFHVSLQVGQDFDLEEIENVNKALASIDVDLDQIEVNINDVVIDVIGTNEPTSFNLVQNCTTAVEEISK